MGEHLSASSKVAAEVSISQLALGGCLSTSDVRFSKFVVVRKFVWGFLIEYSYKLKKHLE